VVLALILLAIASWLLMGWMDRAGNRFFDTGKEIGVFLESFAEALESNDGPALERFYGEAYAGMDLGLGDLRLRDDRDGIRILSMTSSTEAQDRAAAVSQWREYRGGFQEVEEVGLFVHRLEKWKGNDLQASIRFELIGVPEETQGSGDSSSNLASPSGIDRALLKMRLTRGAQGLAIVGAELLEGDRVIAGEPHFEDVASAAGVDFENRYYPRFLSEPLKFGMLRYGPAGITAADVDNDGFQDLFIPDGEESRYFRNLGDGTFEDITEASGLTGLDGVSVALFADYDNDGHKDLFVSRTFEPNQLFLNRGDGTFEDVTAASGIGADCCTTVASWGDIENDGDLDLYVGRYLDPRLAIPTTFYARNGEPNQLYRNEGDGTFTNVTVEAGVGEVGLCLGSVFGDYDDDGDLDLYVVNDFGRKTLYRNDGQGIFEDVTVETGSLAYGAGMSASFGDYDNDMDLDIYVAHIRSEEGWFAEWPTVGRYMLNTWRQGVWKTDMPLYWQIFRQSGFDFIQVFQDMASGNTLLRNAGDGTFEDVSWATNANPPGWFWGSDFADFDNDGWLDVYSANGWVYNDQGTEIELEFLNNVVSEMKEYKTGSFFDPANFGNESWHGWERNRHLRNRGDGTFEEIGRATGTDLLLNSRGTAIADFWNRGVLDIAVAASTDRHALLRNKLEGRRSWLSVELEGAAGTLPEGTNRDAVGARVILEAGGQKQLRELALGDGYSSQNSLRLHFGLGEIQQVDSLTVFWPRSGKEQRFTAVPVNQIVKVREGQNDLMSQLYTASAPSDSSDEASDSEER